ncbi:MIP/aquaporin family protein [Halocatena marina]|uniref:MIP/aquaporin family protein n=1 Tax=Halocatena marina TaxID=2934937 RepID=UPI002413E2B3|nr:MIP/aquaporin family protein [Halocatena marina]
MQRAIAEFIGTFSIVFFGAGAVAIDILTAPKGAGNSTFIFNGLGFGALSWVGVGLAFWAAVTIPIYVFGNISGQHINPAVTFALWLTDRIGTSAAGIYVIAQLLGGIAGAVCFVFIRGPIAATRGVSGATAPFPGINIWQAFANEIIITFFLMIAVMALAIDEEGPSQHAGLIIGFVVGMGVITTGNISGASFNPARTIGPYVSNTIFGGPNFWPFIWIYIFGPIIGAVIGALLYDYMALGRISVMSSRRDTSTEVEAGR